MRPNPKGVPVYPHTLFRPQKLLVPLDADVLDHSVSPELAAFVRARRAKGDVGPLLLFDGEASTPEYDEECVRAELLGVLRARREAP